MQLVPSHTGIGTGPNLKWFAVLEAVTSHHEKSAEHGRNKVPLQSRKAPNAPKAKGESTRVKPFRL